VKYADDLVLLAKEKKVLQGMFDGLTETGICYGLEMNVKKTEDLEKTIPSTRYDRPKTAGECGMFQLFG
jgi:hypothetical protein